MKIRGISAAGLTAALLVIMVAPPSAQGPEGSKPLSQSPQAASTGAVGAIVSARSRKPPTQTHA